MKPEVQEITKLFDSEFDIAEKYYAIVFEMNSLHITKKEISLVAFCATKGTLSTPPVRNEFIEKFGIPKGSVYNMISKLQRLSILVKDKDNKVRVNPQIHPNFSAPNLVLAVRFIKKDKDDKEPKL